MGYTLIIMIGLLVGTKAIYHIPLASFSNSTVLSFKKLNLTSEPTISWDENYAAFNVERSYVSSVEYALSVIWNSTAAISGIGLTRDGVKAVLDDAKLYVWYHGIDDGYLAFPDDHLGNEYIIGTYCSLGGMCWFSVSPIENDTTLHVYFSRAVSTSLNSLTCLIMPNVSANISVGKPAVFILNEFDVLHFESAEDLSGTRVVSDKKVAVVAGAKRIPTENGIKGMVEQIPPTKKWGSSFVFAPSGRCQAGDIVKMITQAPNTLISITGFSPFIVAENGTAVERRIDWGMYSMIEASKPILVLQIVGAELYNDTCSPTTGPTIVLVPDIAHWTNGTAVLPNEYFENVVVIASSSLVILSSGRAVNTSNFSVPHSSHKVITLLSQSETVDEIKTSGAYALIRDGAFLLAADWSTNDEGCIWHASNPGDGIDNDCDDLVDEDMCTEEDLRIEFTASMDTYTGERMVRRLKISKTYRIPFRASVCDGCVGLLVLMSETGDSTSYIQAGTDAVSLTTCTPDGCEQNALNLTTLECNPREMIITLNDTSLALEILNSGYLSTHVPSGVTYAVATITSLRGNASFSIELSEKDCGKIESGPKSSFGKLFVYSKSSHAVLTMYLTTNDTATNITYLNTSISLNAYQTHMATIGQHTVVVISSTNKISVLINQGGVSSKLIPVDVLGPAYRTLDVGDCKVLSYHTVAYIKGPNLQSNVVAFGEEHAFNGSATSHIESDVLVAVYCADGNATLMTQLPPPETLGKQFYIPPLRFQMQTFNISAQVWIRAIEDSTALYVYGQYDTLVLLDSSGDSFNQSLASNQTYNISSFKPVLVELRVTFEDTGKRQSLIIPPVEQYVDIDVIPGFGQNAEVLFSSTVYANGTWNTDAVTTASGVSNISGGFSIILVLISGEKRILFCSDVSFLNINRMCALTNSAVGDQRDNDCDGLVDEEECSAHIDGFFDLDLDGSLNEDCFNGTVTDRSLDLYIPGDLLFCDNATADHTDDISITTSPEMVTTDPNPLPALPLDPDMVIDTHPGLEPLLPDPVSGATIITASTPTTNVSEPVETCYTECICPCGWVTEPKNYTAEELEQIVAAIQEKLMVNKEELSSSIRKLTSAPDYRVEATVVGSGAIVFLAGVLVCIFLLDVTTIVAHLRQLRDTILGR